MQWVPTDTTLQFPILLYTRVARALLKRIQIMMPHYQRFWKIFL